MTAQTKPETPEGAPAPPLECLFEGPRLRACGWGLRRARVLVTFDRRRLPRQGFPELSPVARALKMGAGHLQIDSAENDWFLNDDLPALEQALATFSAARAPGTEIIAAAFSMGGYGALRLSEALRITRILLMAPQVSIFPEQPPHDPRFEVYARPLERRLDTLPQAMPDLGGHVLFDPLLQPVDRDHARLISAQFPGIRRVALPFGGHPPLKSLREIGGWALILEAFLEDRLDTAFLRGLHREARQHAPRHADELARALRRRRRNRTGPDPAPPG